MKIEDVILKGIVVVFIVLCVNKESTSSSDSVQQPSLKINATAEQAEEIVSELKLLPNSVAAELLESDLEISVVDNLPEEYSGSYFCTVDNKYQIKIQMGYIEDAFLHEVGHWFYHTNNLESSDELNSLIESYGAEVLLNELDNNEYYSRYSEFYAETFSMYLHDNLKSTEFNEYFEATVGY